MNRLIWRNGKTQAQAKHVLLQYLTTEFMTGVFIIALHQFTTYVTFYLLTGLTVQLFFGHS